MNSKLLWSVNMGLLTSGFSNVTEFSNDFLHWLNAFLCNEFHPTVSISSLFADFLVCLPLVAAYTSSTKDFNGATRFNNIGMAVRIQLSGHTNIWRSERFCCISVSFNP